MEYNDQSIGTNGGASVMSTDETINVPPQSDLGTEAYIGSMQQILSDNIGNYCIIEFLVGTQGLTSLEGYIYYVGRSYIVLYNQRDQDYTVCDIFSIKFVTFPVPEELQYRGDIADFTFPGEINGTSTALQASINSLPNPMENEMIFPSPQRENTAATDRIPPEEIGIAQLNPYNGSVFDNTTPYTYPTSGEPPYYPGMTR